MRVALCRSSIDGWPACPVRRVRDGIHGSATARPQHVGKQIKCADCGALTVVPEPPKPKPKNLPAALEGEQYELWDPDEQPLPGAIIAVQPTYIPIHCRKA